MKERRETEENRESINDRANRLAWLEVYQNQRRAFQIAQEQFAAEAKQILCAADTVKRYFSDDPQGYSDSFIQLLERYGPYGLQMALFDLLGADLSQAMKQENTTQIFPVEIVPAELLPLLNRQTAHAATQEKDGQHRVGHRSATVMVSPDGSISLTDPQIVAMAQPDAKKVFGTSEVIAAPVSFERWGRGWTPEQQLALQPVAQTLVIDTSRMNVSQPSFAVSRQAHIGTGADVSPHAFNLELARWRFSAQSDEVYADISQLLTLAMSSGRDGLV